MKLLFFGGSKYVIPAVKVLKEKGLNLVVTTEKEKSEPLIKFCLENKIPYFSVSTFDSNLKSEILNKNYEVAVVANFRLKIPSEILNAFPKGIVNIHPSLLPKYRGPTPGQQALLNGDKKSGVTIMLVDEQIDHGPVIVQKEEEINENETADSLYTRFFKIGADLLETNFQDYLDGKIKPLKQDDSKATYTEKLTRESGYFDLDKPLNKEVLKRMINAFFPWPGVWTIAKFENKDLRIKFLPNNFIQVEGKKPISLKDFENGYPILYNKIESILK
jgi:methionyl-tRNA formyltransferase